MYNSCYNLFENHDLCKCASLKHFPMFGTFFFSAKKTHICHVGSPESVNKMYWMYYKKETRCLSKGPLLSSLPRREAPKAPKSQQKNGSQLHLGYGQIFAFATPSGLWFILTPKFSACFNLFQCTFVIKKSCVPILPSIEVCFCWASRCNLIQNDDPIPVPWEKTNSTSCLFKVFFWLGMTRCCPLWYPL